jgi:hypothetical protein
MGHGVVPQQTYDGNFQQMLLSQGQGMGQSMGPQMHLPPGLMLSSNGAGMQGMPIQLQGHAMHPMMGSQPQHLQQNYAQYYQAQQVPLQFSPQSDMSSNPALTRKPWHSPDDAPVRQQIAEQIVTLLQQRRPNATEDWQQKLPNMGKRLEDALYIKANSLDEYQDFGTLKNRLQLLAQQMNQKSQGTPQGRSMQQGYMQQQQQPYQQQMQLMSQQYAPVMQGQMQPQVGGGLQGGVGGGQQQPMQMAYPSQMPLQQSGAPQQQVMLPQQQMQVQQVQQVQQMPAQYAGPLPSQLQPQHQPGQTSRTLTAVSSQYTSAPPGGQRVGQPPQNAQMMGSGMNAIEGFQQQQQQMAVPEVMVMEERPTSTTESDNINIIDSIVEQSQLQQQQQQPHMHGHDEAKRANVSQHSEEHRRQVLKQQQQRLLLLRHASKCPHENGKRFCFLHYEYSIITSVSFRPLSRDSSLC